ncbi:MAG: electron transfer flavoprotein subunit alpha/FixB family protein [Endozoicomonadaceae bacterium]|nr:electron transfer flavoprotein subunit alpha/FixB family protein [Endozoicomonadaceae bacterium]
MKTLIIVEHDHVQLMPSIAHLVYAAKNIGYPIALLVIGSNCQSVAKSAAVIDNVSEVICADASVYEHQLPENSALLIQALSHDYSHILVASSTFGKNLMPRVAALLSVDQISDVIAIQNESIFKRPIYAGNAIATIKSHAQIKVMTVRSTAFESVAMSGHQAPIVTCDIVHDNNLSRFIKAENAASDRPELTAARVVVSGGRGLANADNFQLLYQLADKLNAAVGASRAAVDAGFVPNDMQVGQTGKIVAPDLYIAVGISGAIQHLAGMKDSKVIVAINKDADAPIFKIADYGLSQDLFEVLPELIAKL